MNIEKALEHFQWKFKNHWQPTKKDIDAFNAIIEFKEMQETNSLANNENLAKLWIHQLILLNESKMYTGERSIQVIDEILSKSVYEWVLILQSKLGLMRFNSISSGNVSNKKDNALNHPLNNQQENKELVDLKAKELHDALLHQPKEEDVIKFVNSQVNRVINKFEK